MKNKLRETKYNWKIETEGWEEPMLMEYDSPTKNKVTNDANNIHEFFSMNKMEISTPIGVKHFNYGHSDTNYLSADKENPLELKDDETIFRKDNINTNDKKKSTGNYL